MDISKDKNLPFNIKYPEYNLIPRSSFKRLNFFKFGISNWPDYIEDPDKSAEKEYLYMVKKTVFGSYRFGILYLHESKKLRKTFYKYCVVIQCCYDKIEKVRNNGNICFICFNKGQIQHYRDSNGLILK